VDRASAADGDEHIACLPAREFHSCIDAAHSGLAALVRELSRHKGRRWAVVDDERLLGPCPGQFSHVRCGPGTKDDPREVEEVEGEAAHSPSPKNTELNFIPCRGWAII